MSADMLSYVEFVGLGLCQDGIYVSAWEVQRLEMAKFMHMNLLGGKC